MISWTFACSFQFCVSNQKGKKLRNWLWMGIRWWLSWRLWSFAWKAFESLMTFSWKVIVGGNAGFYPSDFSCYYEPNKPAYFSSLSSTTEGNGAFMYWRPFRGLWLFSPKVHFLPMLCSIVAGLPFSIWPFATFCENWVTIVGYHFWKGFNLLSCDSVLTYHKLEQQKV